jgi:predicted enzyme related to lactoylglutathione lyase
MLGWRNYDGDRREEDEMSERDGFEPGVPCWIDTLQPDPEAAMRFYGAVFGWEFAGPATMPGDQPGEYHVARLRGRDVAGVGSQPSDGAPPAPAWNTFIQVDSADEATEKVKAAGGTVAVEPFDTLPAGRMAVLSDPAGAAFCAWEPRERKGAQIVNEPGAWAMSQLLTNDPEGATAFYGDVFGWTTETFDMGGGEFTMWRLPGYVGGEPKQPVSREVIGVMLPMCDQFPDGAPPRWSANFWIADADAAAAKAGELGGQVVVEPHDTPGFREAVLADPQGAVFSVSQLLTGN